MKRYLLFPFLLLALACRESGPLPPNTEKPGEVLAAAGGATCPRAVDRVVSDQASLIAALAQASPGETIGFDGFFELTGDVVVTVDGLTLTCATPGSGAYGDGPSDDFLQLLWIQSDGVRVEGLRFEAGAGLRAALFVGWWDGVGSGAEAVVTGNAFECRSATCLWFNGSEGPVVSGNRFDISTAESVFSAIQIQQGTTAARVEDNVVVGPQVFGRTGIRIRSGMDHLVTGNRVSGPWLQSLLAVSGGNAFQGPLSNSVLRSNELVGARIYGLLLGGLVCDWTATEVATDELVGRCRRFGPATGNTVTGNRITGAGTAGIAVDAACGNTVAGNDLRGNGSGTGAIFGGVDVFDEVIDGVRWIGSGNNSRPGFPPGSLTGGTGGNRFAGNGALVIDEGNLDCDRDGIPDPNSVSGARAVSQGPAAAGIGDPDPAPAVPKPDLQ